MAETYGSSSEGSASSYRVKYDRQQFLDLMAIARSKIVYRRNNVYFFAFDGFVMYCDQCEEKDVPARMLDAIEFSNYQWKK